MSVINCGILILKQHENKLPIQVFHHYRKIVFYTLPKNPRFIIRINMDDIICICSTRAPQPCRIYLYLKNKDNKEQRIKLIPNETKIDKWLKLFQQFISSRSAIA